MQTKSIDITKITKITYKQLREIKDVLLIEEFKDKPIAVLIPYEYYLEMQSLIIRADSLLSQIETSEESNVG